MSADSASADRPDPPLAPQGGQWQREPDSSRGVSIPVIEETFVVSKREVDAGGVRIVKTVETHSEEIDEPLHRDTFDVERRKVDRAVTGAQAPAPYWQGDTFVVPVVEEVLVVSKQLRVIEEVLIHHRRTAFRAPQHVSLRRETVAVERTAPAGPIHQQETKMNTALVGVFENREQATKAYNELLTAGFPSSDVTLRAGGSGAGGSGTATSSGTLAAGDTTAGRDTRDDGDVGSTIGDWFRSLFGLSDDDDELYAYDEALRRGHYLLTVASVSDERIDTASDIMEGCGSVDIEERATQWQQQGWTPGRRSGAGASTTGVAMTSAAMTGSGLTGSGLTGSSTAAGASTTRAAGTSAPLTGAAGAGASTGASAGMSARTGVGSAGVAGSGTSAHTSGSETRKIPVVEEELRVGKRVVGRGGVRVYSRVVDRPVEETVRLREERATVERRPVDRPATDADFRALEKGTLEVRGSAEEAVVSKQARVTEEIEVGKEVRERSETVRDTVRHTEVQVEKTGDMKGGGVTGTGSAARTGVAGSAGTTGVVGTAGAAGGKGTAGTSGTTGTTGTTGTPGSSGIGGTPGGTGGTTGSGKPR